MRFLAGLLAALFLLGPARAARAGEDQAVNVLIFWTDHSRLKAVTLMSITPHKKPVGIVSIPVNALVREGGAATLEELFYRAGREGVTAYLEKRFGIPITHYVDVSQETLARTSEALGPLAIDGKKTSLLEVFEGTYTAQRLDLQAEIRALAARLIEPPVLVKLPRLLWIFTTGVETNLGVGQIIALYQALQGNGPEILRKKALPGYEFSAGARRYCEVPPEAWWQVLREVTREY
ncbi:LCP family protein [Desulfovirgula thermocuniculi]|uniref:LCP family protein n=1 Tax=Desulfovirgula thermocuniculi TaxID=348842 RepID=UPI00040191A7|nr:LCP family protein [Desulfovirgula thermocuniculi]